MPEEKQIPNIPLTPVTSSQIMGIGHDPDTNTLAIQFNGGNLYHYAGFGAEAFEEFKSAKSLGSHFGKAIRGNFNHTKIPAKKK